MVDVRWHCIVQLQLPHAGILEGTDVHVLATNFTVRRVTDGFRLRVVPAAQYLSFLRDVDTQTIWYTDLCQFLVRNVLQKEYEDDKEQISETVKRKDKLDKVTNRCTASGPVYTGVFKILENRNIKHFTNY